jgi:hypothetical protein
MCGKDEELADVAASGANGLERDVAGAGVARELGVGAVLEKRPALSQDGKDFVLMQGVVSEVGTTSCNQMGTSPRVGSR